MSIIGALQYITLTINKICQFMLPLHKNHWLVVKCILSYLKSTMYYYMVFKPSKLEITGFSNLDWVTCLLDRKSTPRVCVYLNANSVVVFKEARCCC